MPEKIITIDTEEKMKKDYIDYAMSVITDRALADVRDGFKPVHRRIAFSMHELGITYDKGYRKCARIVGDVLGKYHPHGDASVYDALVRMAQDFSMRYPLVDGHGNFGSVDGDSPAAMRYTEAKQTKIFSALTKDLDKNTVDFIPNFDGEEKEPTVLPVRFPNLLVNGCDGIAVGMATKMPPHNLRECIDGTICLIENPNSTLDDVMGYIKAPDFPTGGNIINKNEMKSIYETGEGKITIRCVYHMEKIKDKNAIIVTEIPYQVNKAKLVETIYELTRPQTIKKKNGKEETIPAKISDIHDVRDESDRTGMRIVIELKKNADGKAVINDLFNYSKLQNNFAVNMLALVDGQPMVLNLIQILKHFIDFQKDIVTRRTKFDLEKAKSRLHILEGLVIALDNIDLIIDIIKQSPTTKVAKDNLMNRFGFTTIQAQAVLDLKLQKLTNLEREMINDEHKMLMKEVEHFNKILSDDSELMGVIKSELIEIRNKFGDERRTVLSNEETLPSSKKVVEEVIKNYNTVIYLTRDGYFKKVPAISLRGSSEHRIKDGDEIIREMDGENIDDVLIFTDKGNIYRMKAHQIQDSKLSVMGTYLPQELKLKDEKIIDACTTHYDNDNRNVLIFYKNGNIAKVPLSSYQSNYTLLKGNENNPICKVNFVTEDAEYMLITSEGKALIISSKEINKVTSRKSIGVKGITVGKGYELICVICEPYNSITLTIHTDKYGKIDQLVKDIEYYRGSRGNIGLTLYNCKQKKDKILDILL